MIRKVRILGTAFIVALALSAVGASAAAAEGFYKISAAPATGTATSKLGNDKFTTEAGNVECAASFHSIQNVLNAASLTVTPTYTECKAFGFAASVAMGSCDYLFTTPVTTATPGLWTAKVHVKCTNPASPITITAGPCKVTVGEQSPGGHVMIKNTPQPAPVKDDVDVRATVEGINYTVTQDGFLCPFNGTGAKTGATYIQGEEITFHSPTADISVGH